MILALVAVLFAVVALAATLGALEWLAADGTEPTEPVPSPVAAGPSADPAADAFAAPRTDSRPEVAERPFARDLGDVLRVDVGLAAGHEAFLRAWPPLLVGGWILSFLDSNGSGGSNEANAATDAGSEPWGDVAAGLFEDPVILVSAVIGAVVCVLAVMLVRAWIVSGWTRVHREVLVDGASSFGTLFGGGDRTLPMVGWRFLRSMVLAPVLVLALSPLVGAALADPDLVQAHFTSLLGLGGLLGLPAWLWVGPGLAFGEHFVALDEDGPLDALKHAWRAARGNRTSLIAFWLGLVIAQFAITLAGFLLLCVGVLISIPYARATVDVGWTRAWLVARHGREATEAWAIQ